MSGSTMTRNMIGPQGRLYADPQPSPDETGFRVNNTDAAYYNSPYYLAHKSQLQAVPGPRNTHALDLAEFLSPDILAAIGRAGKIVFHATGDTGAAKVNKSQTVATAIGNEAHVADAMSADVQKGGSAGPAFLFNLGDVIYNFGQAEYYYDQFYEPFRDYDRPIFAIPGNHDGSVFGSGSSAPQVPTLAAFLENFCAIAPAPSPDSGSLVRTVMTQPGVYFSLDAPFVSIIGLYSNVLEGPGVISSQSGHYPIDDQQLTFLKGELARLKPQRQANQRAIVIAVHHPPLSADAVHGGSTGLQADLDACCEAAGVWPDLILSGHAHLYQRFTRTNPGGKQTPYIVCGSGGYAVTRPLGALPQAPVTLGDHTLEKGPILRFGYLTIETDGKSLTAEFTAAQQGTLQVLDSVTVDLTTQAITSGGSASKIAGRKGKSASARKKMASPRKLRRK